ncbi:DUF937 domain-containing protein [Streptomyces sp. V1I1]|uniref:DUF937 domain-containing protein n=1 Tax=Streptomyces sp. V1I1 TaxID=3042272 RepID=UPI0027D76E1E|nr:DUF937 domain-containing protein [Streptomyces sp. V1I1]
MSVPRAAASSTAARLSSSAPHAWDVLTELGDDKLQEIAGLLGTDAAGAQSVVESTVSAMSGGLQEKAAAPEEAEEVRHAVAEVSAASSEPPLEGAATLGGRLGGLISGVLGKMSRPVAEAVSKKTGIPAKSVTRAIEVLIPVVLAVLTKRGKGQGRGAEGSSGRGRVGRPVGHILGGGAKK